MTKNEAFLALNITDESELAEASEMALFQLKSKYLQQVPPLKLIDSQLKRIKKVRDAVDFFEPSVHPQIKFKLDYLNPKGLLEDELKWYQNNISTIRLQIANAQLADDLLFWVEQLKNLQIHLFKVLSDVYLIEISDLNELDVKISDPMDVYQIQKELSTLLLSKTEIKQYICTQLSDGLQSDFSPLVKSVIQAQKQLQNYGIRR